MGGQDCKFHYHLMAFSDYVFGYVRRSYLSAEVCIFWEKSGGRFKNYTESLALLWQEAIHLIMQLCILYRQYTQPKSNFKGFRQIFSVLNLNSIVLPICHPPGRIGGKPRLFWKLTTGS